MPSGLHSRRWIKHLERESDSGLWNYNQIQVYGTRVRFRFICIALVKGVRVRYIETHSDEAGSSRTRTRLVLRDSVGVRGTV